MKKIIPIFIVGIFVLSGLGAIGSPEADVSLSNFNAEGSFEFITESRIGKATYMSRELGTAQFNNSPTQPIIEGPSIGAVNWTYCFTITSQDPEGDNIYYFVDWGDGTVEDWFGPYNSGQVVTVCHTYTKPGYYLIIVKAKDDTGTESEWSDPFEITIVENQAPLEPEINGPKKGTAGKGYDWTFEAIDPDGDDMEFFICWGGTCAGAWYGPFASGEVFTLGYSYMIEGTFTIICMPRDIYGVEGPTASFEVIMPKNKAIEYQFFGYLLNHLNLFPLLRLLLQRLEH